MSTETRGEEGEERVLHDLEVLGESKRIEGVDVFADLGALGSVDDRLHITADGLVARLWRIDAGSTRADIDALLQHMGVSNGIDEEALDRALISAQRGQVQIGLVVARGTPAGIIAPARAIYHPGLEGEEAHFAEFLQRLQGPSLHSVFDGDFEAVVVAPELMLAEWLQARYSPGLTVRGQPFYPPVSGATAFQPGSGARKSEDGKQCLSAHYGYAGLIDGRIHVVPPLWFSPDRSEVHLVHLPSKFLEPPPSQQNLLDALRAAGIERGIDMAAVEEACRRIADGAEPFSLCLARSLLAELMLESEVHYTFNRLYLLSWNQWLGLLNSENLAQMRESLDLLLRDDELCCPLKRRGDVLGEKVDRTDAESEWGEVGKHVAISDDGFSATADMAGYVCLRGVRIEVIPPVWVAPDASAAYFINLPQGDEPYYPQAEEIKEVLDLVGVKYGFRDSDWFAARDALAIGQDLPPLIPIALASSPSESRDAAFEWAIDIEGDRVGKILEDGSIDFRQRSRAPAVSEGDLIGTFTPPSAGAPGRDVLGRDIPAMRPQRVDVIAGAHVREEVQGDIVRYYAEQGGEVISDNQMQVSRNRTLRRLRLSVSQVVNVDGDVDYSTGNIDFSGDVVIRGSVQSLFSVRAEGSVHISGYIEDGAVVSAGKDIMVGGGVLGAATQVEAGGSLWVKFAQEANIRAGGDVRVGSYIFNASVRASGRVIVLGRGEGKARALVGGLVWGGQGIETLSVGSPYNSVTRLVSGVDFLQVERMESLRSALYTCEERMQQHMKKLDITTLDIELIRARLQRRTSPKNRRLILASVKRLARLNERREALQEEMDAIVKEQRQLARLARIVVRGTLFSGVEVRLGETVTTFGDERTRLQMRLVEKEGTMQIVERPVS